jgi:hypothetical protein
MAANWYSIQHFRPVISVLMVTGTAQITLTILGSYTFYVLSAWATSIFLHQSTMIFYFAIYTLSQFYIYAD